jgi:hypothetical protein
MDNQKSGCRIVTVNAILPLYKETEQANRVELITLNEVGNEIVSQKDLYKTGDKALFIEPDYCLPDNVFLFQEYIKPTWDGIPDPKKSRLGKNNRVRAIKFNLHKGDNNPVYSYGILIPYEDACKHASANITNNDDLDKIFEITKYEEPEPTVKGGLGKPVGNCAFPSDMYKTDEININNVINDIKFPIHLIGTEKVDGSSITIYYKDNGNFGICSRNQGKALSYQKVFGKHYRWWENPNIINLLKTLRILKDSYKPKGRTIYQTVPSEDTFVTVGKPYLRALIIYCEKNNLKLALRGELCGAGSRGSGNPNNPHAKEPAHIEFFGLDNYACNTIKENQSYFKYTIDNIFCDGIFTSPVRVTEYFNKVFHSLEELKQECNKHFWEQKVRGRIIEGIVVKTPDSKFSCKIMNMEYDLKK